MFREVQAEAEELISLAEYKEEIEGDWSSFDLQPPPMFTSKYFDLWVIRMLTFLQAKDLLEHWSNNPYDEVCDDLALNFIKQGLGKKFLCKVVEATTSNEAWKILEAEFGTRGTNQVKDNRVVYPVVVVLEYENEDGFVVENLHRDEGFFESHLKVDHNVDGVLSIDIDGGLDNVANGEAHVLEDPTIEIANVKFDEEQLTCDEWLKMMQHKHLIDTLLFGERIPLAYEIQVEET